MNMSESVNANRHDVSRVVPAIMYNHHQTGPAGAVLFAPPFRDPFNYNFDPLIPLGIDTVGAAIHTRLAAEGKPGAVMRTGAPYSTWFNGGIRTTSYFHNQIGILTETIGNPTPVEIPFVLDMQLPRADVPNPIAAADASFPRSDRVLDHRRTTRSSTSPRSGTRTSSSTCTRWRRTPSTRAAATTGRFTASASRRRARRSRRRRRRRLARRPRTSARAAARGGGFGRGGAPVAIYNNVLHDPKMRDPRGFILPSDQPDFLTATKFVNTLIKAGVVVHRATAPFTVAGKQYPAGSYVVKAAQPFRAHLMDMFEPQDHPDDIPYPGGAPRPPYDVTGYNIAYSMGIKFDRILDAFDGPFEKIADLAPVPQGKVTQAPSGGGYLLSHR